MIDASEKVILSPPFGNYVTLPKTISVLGSYTLHKRCGAVKQFLKTVRPYQKGFINKIGLRNPGIFKLTSESKKLSSSIVSLAVLEAKEWTELAQYMLFLQRNFQLEPRFLELNLSCPNVEVTPIDETILSLFSGFNCIIKLPPSEKLFRIIDMALECGIHQFHLCNTLATAKGGISGPKLKELSLEYILHVRQRYPDITIIGGGGIYDVTDVDLYQAAGADAISLATILLKRPWAVFKVIQRANVIL